MRIKITRTLVELDDNDNPRFEYPAGMVVDWPMAEAAPLIEADHAKPDNADAADHFAAWTEMTDEERAAFTKPSKSLQVADSATGGEQLG